LPAAPATPPLAKKEKVKIDLSSLNKKPAKLQIVIDVSNSALKRRFPEMTLTEDQTESETIKSTELTKQDALAKDQKAKLPFAMLESFAASAEVLSFVGYSDEVNALLKQLSHRTRRYGLSHMDILRGFLQVFQPAIVM